ncbi:putative porin [Paraburkholderia unamae]|uniref:porin n=1 Tax=Paraburkholderia unamae TaxID=219649 RepID=UPI000DC4BD81|nr:porin [Paraburkholderia unamae]RAR56419.1 putative porin [Paraburkholderia unamae]
MKRAVWTLCALGATSCITGAAHAQSSVTLYGIVDEGIIFNSNSGGNRQYYMASGVLSGSRFGFRGVEDLGGGLKAVMTLENGFDVNSGKLGQGGLMFGRQAFVGLASDRYGSLLFGRQFDSAVDFVGPLGFAALYGGYITATVGDMDNFAIGNRLNNVIKYLSADYGGFTFGGLYSPGGVAGDFSRNEAWGVGAGYTRGPLRVGVSFTDLHDPNVSFYGTSVAGATAATNNMASVATRGFASAAEQQNAAAAVSYTIAATTVSGTWSHVTFKDMSGVVGVLNPAGLSGSVTFNNFAIALKYQWTPALLTAAQFARMTGSSVAGKQGAAYNQVDIAADYLLSKRTDVYFTAVYQTASGTQSDGKPAVAAINVISPSSTSHQAAVRFAIRHRF